MPALELTVACTAAKYWVAVDDIDVIDTQPFGHTTIPAGDHLLTWWMKGKVGDTISVTGTSGGNTVVTVAKTAITGPGPYLASDEPFII